MIRSFFSVIWCLLFFVGVANAQEICNNNFDDDGDGLVDCLDGDCPSKICEICDNGLDDDLDGFVDCYDKECNQAGSLHCQDFFLTTDADCSIPPVEVHPVQFQLKYKSAPNLTNHVNRLVVGDIDNDQVTDIITVYAEPYVGSGGKDDADSLMKNQVNILGVPGTGSELITGKQFNVPFPAGTPDDAVSYDDIAIADIDHDGCGEIFIITRNMRTNSNYKIIAYHCDGTLVWNTPILIGNTEAGLIGLADFDGDNKVELYSRTRIYDAHTGTFMGSYNIDDINTGINMNVNKGWGMNNSAPVAVDIDPVTPGLELVAGCRVYAVAINRTAMTATLTLTREVSSYATRTARNKGNGTSVADFNQDGFLDILAVGSMGAYDDNTTIFFWDYHKHMITGTEVGSYKTFSDFIPGPGNYTNGWVNGASRISIADIDGDTLMNAVFVSGKYMYALKEGPSELSLLWRTQVADETSGFTGVTTFDLNGDGITEILYRDEDYLRVYNTDNTGAVVQTSFMPCKSRTQHEYPVVADVDGDGAAEVCITCSTSYTTPGKNLGMWSDAEVRVYGSANVPWVPARKVWNQHAYFVTNVNDDLTIPRNQQLHHLPYAKNAECHNFEGFVRPLNAFMAQATYLGSSGCQQFPAVDLNLIDEPFSGHFIQYKPFNGLSDSIQVTFSLDNKGSLQANGMLKISFYNGDPQVTSPLATHLATRSFQITALNPGDTISVTTNIKNPGSGFDLFVVLNDDGTTLPLDLVNQQHQIRECDYEYYSAGTSIVPVPFQLDHEVVRDNIRCITAQGLPENVNNGEIAAYVLVNGVRENVNFNFYWSIGTAPKPQESIDFIGPVFTALGSGAYTVYGVHKTQSFLTDTVTVVVNELSTQIDAKVVVQKDIVNNDIHIGELRTVVNDTDNDGIGESVENFSYAWYEGVDILVGDTLAIDHTLTGLGAGTYSVVVRDEVTGCYDSASATIHPKVVLGPEDAETSRGVRVYPNPGNESLTVVVDNLYRGKVQLQLQSVLGNEVERSISSRKEFQLLEIPVDTRNLESGVYMIKIFLGKETLIKKWVKH